MMCRLTPRSGQSHSSRSRWLSGRDHARRIPADGYSRSWRWRCRYRVSQLHTQRVLDRELTFPLLNRCLSLFFGGMLQLIACLMEWMLGNTFSFLVFGSFGAAWFSLASTNLLGVMGIFTADATTPDAVEAAQAEFYSSFGMAEYGSLFVMTVLIRRSTSIWTSHPWLHDHDIRLLCTPDQYHFRLHLRYRECCDISLRRFILGTCRRKQASRSGNAKGCRCYILRWVSASVVLACGQFAGSPRIRPFFTCW